MDLGSPNMEDGTPFKSELDLNSHENKDEEKAESFQDDNKELEEGMQVYVDQEGLRSPVVPADVVSEGLKSPTAKPTSAASSSPINKVEEQDKHLPIESEFDDDVEEKSLVHSSEALRSNVEDHEYHDKKQEASCDFPSGNLLDIGADQMAEDEKKLGDSDPDFHEPVLSVDNNLNSQSEKAENDNDGREDGNSGHHMEMKEDDHIMENFDNGEIFKESSGGHSPLPTQKGTPSPSPEKELCDHMGRSPDTKPSAMQDQLPTEISDRKSAHYPKRTPSPEKRAVGRKRASRDSLSPPARRKSPPGRTIHQDVHRRDLSPRKNLSASPRRGESPRRRDRSTSPSPVRQKDTSGHRRDHRGRSRSRSPYARDHYRRSPRRRHSPGRRSPPPSYHSRHRSPRRPWSPPTNRNTGVGRPGRNLFVAGFSYVTTERDLEKKFSRFGRVTDVRIVRDRRSGDSRGFGFLSLERDEDADAAIRALDQTEWNGRIVLVEKSKTSAR